MNNLYCSNCGAALSGGNFCVGCGTPAPSFGPGQTFARRVSAQSNTARKAVEQMKLIGFGNLLPYKDWLAEKPWNLFWVRWFLGIALFPLFLMFLASTADLSFNSVAFLFGLYFAMMWAAVLYFMLMPRIQFIRILQISMFTIVVGITVDLLVQQLPIISSLYSATESASIVGRLIGFVCGVGILEECVKILPVWWIYIHREEQDSLSTIVFLGCISGFAFGVAEAANYSISYALGLKYGRIGFSDYLMAQMTRLITLPLLHAVWSGIFAYFVALASVNKRVRNGLLLAGLLIAAFLHGFYDTLSDSLIGVGVAVLSILVFVAYYRSGQTLQAKIASVLANQPPG